MASRLFFLFLPLIFWDCASRVISHLPTTEETYPLSKQIQWIQSAKDFSLRNQTLEKDFIKLSLEEPFLQSFTKETTAKYRMASFQFKESLQKACTEQSIDEIKKETGKITIKGKLTGKDCSSDYQIVFVSKSDTEIELKITLSDPTLNRIQFQYGSHPEERIFGLGEQFTYDELKGKTPFLFTEEQGVGRGDQPITTGANLLAGAGGNAYTTYAPIPHYITSENRSVFFVKQRLCEN